MTKARQATIALALIAGLAGGWFALPVLSRYRALNGITHADPSERRAGWKWLLATGDERTPRVATLIDRVNGKLADAPDEAVLDGAAALRPAGLWGWDHQSPTLIMREMALRAAAGEPTIVAVELMEAPFDLDGERLRALVDRLLHSDVDAARDRAFAAACAWAGPEGGAWLARLRLREQDTRLRRQHHLAASWCAPVPAPPPIDPGIPAAVLEALLLHTVRADPDNVDAVLALRTADPPPAVLPDVLRYARDPDALIALRQMADAGNKGAVFALQTRSRERDEAQSRLVIADPEASPAIRRLAAFRWNSAPMEQVRAVLALEPADADGAVYAAALLAERRLPPVEAAAQAETWIRSFNDDEKRAGALLAALLGTHTDLLRDAFDLEDMPRVRTVQRLALAALGIDVGPEDLEEFGYRVLHNADGSLNADTLLCLLAAGRRGALTFVTRRPRVSAPAVAAAVQKRALLLERFAPSWYAVVGRPIGSSARGLYLYFDDLDSAQMLMRRRLAFDPESRTYRVD